MRQRPRRDAGGTISPRSSGRSRSQVKGEGVWEAIPVSRREKKEPRRFLVLEPAGASPGR